MFNKSLIVGADAGRKIVAFADVEYILDSLNKSKFWSILAVIKYNKAKTFIYGENKMKRTGISLKFVISAVAIAFLINSETSVLSQEYPGCFMIDDEESFIDLSTLCPTPPSPPPPEGEPVLGTGDVQVTLRWSTTDDLDLAVEDPGGEQADFTSPRISSGGELDVDSNAGCGGTTTSPVENVFWPTSGAPSGDYVAKVNFYSRCQSDIENVDFTLTISTGGNAQEFSGTLSSENETLTFPFSFP